MDTAIKPLRFWHIQDMRLARLVMLLRQLHECVDGLGRLPKPELNEIVSSAVRMCGFEDPIEAGDVTDAVLDAIEVQDPNAVCR
ncbi:MAG: hypothetical protein WB919_15990 [Candidatus Sulfotelmatobacter sp.]